MLPNPVFPSTQMLYYFTMFETKNYKLLLFDADDTLFDFQKSQHATFHRLLQDHGINESLFEMYTDYQAISQDLWSKLERNEISKDHLKSHRFKLLFEKYNLKFCPQNLGEKYLDLLSDYVYLLPDAKDILEILSKKYVIGLVTNGVEKVQKERFARSGLSDYVSFMVVSEECGYHKPDRRIFDYALKIKSMLSHETLMIGDKIEADVLGATNAGIDSCWYNPGKLKNHTSTPTFEIQSLRELTSLI